jgi:hypothetical protein
VTLTYLRALHAREEARMRDLESWGIHRVDAWGNVLGEQLPARFLDEAGGSAPAGRLPTPSSMESPVWHPEAVAYT